MSKGKMHFMWCVYGIVSQNAIYFETNEYGFCYPRIDDAKCVDCGLCRKSCHVLNELNGNIPQKAYAVWSSDSEDRKTSTSGGAASVFIMRF